MSDEDIQWTHFYDETIHKDLITLRVENYAFTANASVVKNRSVYIANALEVDRKIILFSESTVTSFQLRTFLRMCYKIAGFEYDEYYEKDEDHYTEFMELYFSNTACEVQFKFLGFMGADVTMWNAYDTLFTRVYEEKHPYVIFYKDIFIIDKYRENIPKTLDYMSLYIASTMMMDIEFRKKFFCEKRSDESTLSSTTLARITEIYFTGEAQVFERWDTQLEKACFTHVKEQSKEVGRLLWNARRSLPQINL